MNAFRFYILFVLYLLVPPAAAESWFDAHRIEIQIRQVDANELRDLVSLLVPYAEYDVVGATLVVGGESEDLTQVQDLINELDRPKDEVMIRIRAFEISETGYDFICGGMTPKYLTRKVRVGAVQRSGVWLRKYRLSHPHSDFPFLVAQGEARLLFQRDLRSRLGSDSTIELPNELSQEIFGVKNVRLKVGFRLSSMERLSALFRFEKASVFWQGRSSSYDGEPLIVGGPSRRWVVVIRPFLIY